MHLQPLSLGVLTLLASTLVRAQDPYNVPASGRPHGVDIGNIVCGGQCVSDPNVLACPHIEYRPQLECYECCISDDDLDDLDLD
ncbi:uncharacterized protein DSM5745_07360 [Aspergillus mulundensis]|uniref:Uncharacterized protein n=1 Tax=Aspergillus mulundensis TaxID=1810919 RepID=A0A3D8RL67_9EURO|nr:Uncharacterized protein DSM5745_07360 [Aspergillus mulundensis]RDW74698.1 Uncharacterized protein DSM5745_07360 [Aspergillus mulundensis]